MAKKTTVQKEPVKLREKKLANGNSSLYLDIYRNGNGIKNTETLSYRCNYPYGARTEQTDSGNCSGY